MKENMMPNPAELEKIQKENLTDEQIEKDKEREEAFNAGESAGRSEMGELLTSGEMGYNKENGFFHPQDGVTENQVIDFIKAIPKLDTYDVCGAKVISEEVIKTVVEKFPNAVFMDLHLLKPDGEHWIHKVREMGGKTDQDEYWDEFEKNKK